MIKWMLSKGQGKTMGTYYTLLNALAEDGRIEEAEELWTKIFSENLESVPRVFFIKMISIYYTRGMNEKLFEVILLYFYQIFVVNFRVIFQSSVEIQTRSNI